MFDRVIDRLGIFAQRHVEMNQANDFLRRTTSIENANELTFFMSNGKHNTAIRSRCHVNLVKG